MPKCPLIDPRSDHPWLAHCISDLICPPSKYSRQWPAWASEVIYTWVVRRQCHDWQQHFFLRTLTKIMKCCIWWLQNQVEPKGSANIASHRLTDCTNLDSTSNAHHAANLSLAFRACMVRSSSTKNLGKSIRSCHAVHAATQQTPALLLPLLIW